MRTLTFLSLLCLTACASDRFSSGWSPAQTTPPPVIAPPPTLYQQNPNADLETLPSQRLPQNPIQSTPLPNTSTNSPTFGGVTLPPPADGKPIIATSAPIPSVPTIPRPNIGALGTWTVKDTEGACRLTLTSQAFFDFQRASSNCKGASLSKVNAWEKKGSEIILYEPGGRVAARLADQGGSYAGSTSKGAEIQMSR